MRFLVAVALVLGILGFGHAADAQVFRPRSKIALKKVDLKVAPSAPAATPAGSQPTPVAPVATTKKVEPPVAKKPKKAVVAKKKKKKGGDDDDVQVTDDNDDDVKVSDD